MKYLTETDLFKEGSPPVMWLEWLDGSWAHLGHVDVATFDQQLRQPIGQFDALEVIPGTLTHEWMRFAEHDPDGPCDIDSDWCDCAGASEPEYLWRETATQGAQGAIPVTVVYASRRMPAV